MAPGEAPLSRLDELRLQRELKEIMLDNVRAIYGPRNPNSHGFDIVTHRILMRKRKRSNDTRSEHVVVRAIVYTEANFGKWKILQEGGCDCHTMTAALQEFWRDLEREMDKACGGMREGESFDGQLPREYFSDPWEEARREVEEKKRWVAERTREEEKRERETEEREREEDVKLRQERELFLKREEIRKRALARTAALKVEMELKKED